MNFLQFREAFFEQGIFSTRQVRLMFPGFNQDNLLFWQKKGYIKKLRNTWYCFTEFLSQPDAQFIIANAIYSPSYISHQQALMYYGMIPEFIVDSTSVTTRKTASFEVEGRTYKYYNIKKELFFGYGYIELNINGRKRNVLMASREKALLDLLYYYSFYRNQSDLEQLRLNESVLENELNEDRLQSYLDHFHSKTLNRKVRIIQKNHSL
ncbi:MAG: hypothetical protein K9I68_06665 [Bacteroidales bacterium]|nr:hypothetical protein [Bacteroidales bacterium]